MEGGGRLQTMQACVPQLSRRRHHTISDHLEAWLERGEGLDYDVRKTKCNYSHPLDLHTKQYGL